jgi:hypothetical protein
MAPSSRIDPVYLERTLKPWWARERAGRGVATDADELALAQEWRGRFAEDGIAIDETGKSWSFRAPEWDRADVEAVAAILGEKRRDDSLVLPLAVLAVGILGLVGLLVWFAAGGRGPSRSAPVRAGEGIVVATNEASGAIALDASITDLASALALRDKLGVKTNLGMPVTLEIISPGPDGLASQTLSLVPAPVDRDGRMAILREVESGGPVGQWAFGTVVNYVVGVHQQVVDQIRPGSTVIIRTSTAAAYHFTCPEPARQVAPQETEIFRQSEPAVTLFPLPATRLPASVAHCLLDSRTLLAAAPLVSSLGQSVTVGGIELRVEEVAAEDRLDGGISLRVTGSIVATEAQVSPSVLIGLDSSAGPFSPLGNEFMATRAPSRWLALFELPPRFAGAEARLNVQAALGSDSAVVDLERIPRAADALVYGLEAVAWDATAQAIVASVRVQNPAPGSAYLAAESFAAWQGSERAAGLVRGSEPLLPLLLPPGQHVLVQLRLLPAAGAGPIRLTTGREIWEITGSP